MYSIAIPSLGRSSIINSQTLKVLEDHNIPAYLVTIFVVDFEYNDYRKVVDNKYKIIIGDIGLVEQRNFIENYYDVGYHIIFLDDDIKSIDLSFSPFQNLNSFFCEAFDDCMEKKSFIWSIYPVFNSFFREKRDHVTDCLNYCIGAFYGIINRPYDNDLKINITSSGDKEDVERSILYFKKDGKVLRYNRIGFETKYYGNVGGLGTLKERMSEIIKNALALQNAFPEYGNLKIRKNGIHEFVLKKIKSFEMDREIIYKEAFDKSICDKLYGLLNDAKFCIKNGRNNRRNFPKHQALIFGITKQRFNGKVCNSVATDKYPHIFEELKHVAKQINPDFNFSSMHINHNLVCPKHKDETNVGKSMLISIGDYSGCKLMVENICYDTHCRAVLFNGSCLEHWNTNDLVGNKYSIVFYNSPYVNDLKK